MILWRDAMSVGSPALDADNKKLIELLNSAEESVSGESWATVGAVIADLQVYARDHFAREEAVLAAIKYGDLEAHKALHASLSTKARLLGEKFAASATDDARRTCGAVLTKVLNEWLIHHVLKHDMKFKPLLPKKVPSAVPVSGLSPPTGLPPPTQAEQDAERRARQEARNKDVEYQLPPNLAHLLDRIEYVTPELPPPATGFESFDKFCEAAIWRRVNKVLVFFQRHNPSLALELPPFFLASPEFAERFRDAVGKLIIPIIWESRQIRMLATSFNWADEDTDSFWDHVTKPLEQCILAGWAQGWDDLKLVEVKRSDGTRVMQVKDNTKALREMLLPSTPAAYDIPKVGNREIATFKSLLDPANDWSVYLNRAWRICHDLYEQEKDPRVFQQKAREGAFRDGLLNTFDSFPPEWTDFLVLACHRVFPRITTSFLESFARNLGRTEAQREEYIPYTIRYLRQAREHPDITLRECGEEAEWQAKMKELSDYLADRPSK